MAQKLYNRYNMQMATLSCMRKNETKWRDNAHVAETVAYIEPRLARVQELFDAKEGTDTEGLTAHKNTLLDRIAHRAWLMAKRLTVFARKRGLQTLLVEVDHPESYFSRGPEVERISRAVAIIGRAEHYLPQLDVYKITLADVAALNGDIEEVRPLSGQRDAVGDEKIQFTQSIPRLLQEVQEKLYELDDEMLSFMDDQPDFQETYFHSRRITDRRTTRADL